jgi:hypothetical protein
MQRLIKSISSTKGGSMRSFLTYLLILFFMASTGFSQDRLKVKKAIKFVKTPPLTTITPIPPQDRTQAWKIMKKMIPNPSLEEFRNVNNLTGMDPVLQSKMGTKDISLKDMSNFEGVGNVNVVVPPDNMGDVGPSHYFQMINLSFAVFNKNGRMIYGPADNNTLWQNLPGPWSSTNDGDPIVLYDELAGRWVVSQFALPNFPDGPFYELVAVSETSDPQGSWYLYAFELDDMPDYPKMGVWTDAYYLSVNSFSASSLNFMGAGVAALERDKMLAGDPNAQMIFYQQGSSVYSLLPADLDGTSTPPAGSPGIFAELGTNSLNIYNFLVDWDTPSNSMFVGPTALPIAAYSDVCSSRDCVPQAGTSDRIDALSGRLMFRLQYRYFGANDERMVTNHTVDNGNGIAAIRWYELRNDGSGWSVYQQGTYSPDDTWRWMGSIAMDINGNIALGYSASSSSITPEIRFTGRFANDPLNEMTIQEETIFQGPGAQTGVNRWGDYTNMTVDPSDGVTFWYTNEYSNGGWNWGTRVAGFTFEIDNTPPAAVNDLQVVGTVSNTVTLQWSATGDDGMDGNASRYDIRYSTTPINDGDWINYPQFPNDIIPQAPGSTETITVTGLDFATTYYFAVKVIDNLGNYSDISNTPTGTTADPPVIAVNPTSLSADLLTGQTEDASFDITNEGTAGSDLEYYLEIRPVGNQHFPKKPLTDEQLTKMRNDVNKRGNGIYPKMYVLASKDDLLIDEGFENGVPPADWTVVDNAGTGVVWKTAAEWSEGNYTGGEGEAATASSDAAGHVMFDTELWTPSINIMGRRDIYLSYKANFQDIGNQDFLDVDLSFDGGTTWTTVLSWNEDHGSLHGTPGEDVAILLDDYIPTSASDMIIRWHYHTIDSDPWNWYAQIDDVQLVAGGSAWLTVNPMEGTVGVGETVTSNVTFSAVGMFGGTYAADIAVISNDPANPEVPVRCTLDVTGVADIDVQPTEYDFGTLFVNELDSTVVTVANIGTDDLTISSITFDNTDYSASDNAFVLAAGESRDVMVYFMASHTGEDNATMTVASSDVDEPTVTVTFTAFGSDAPVVDVQPTTLSADLLTGQTSDDQFTVSNVATATSSLEYMVAIEYPGNQHFPKKSLNAEQIRKLSSDKGKTVGNGIYPTMYALGRKDNILLEEDFENGVPPENWTVVDNAGTGVVWKTSTEWNDGNYTGGEGEAADVNSDEAGHVMFDTELWTPSITVAGRQDIYLSYKANFQDLGNQDFLDVDLSFDGGATWTTVLSWNEDHGQLNGTPGEEVTILLDDYIPGGANNMIIRWHYHTTDSDPWQWYAQIDDVQLVGGSAWLAVDPTEGTLLNGESATHDVHFSANGMFGGDYNANIVVYSNDPVTPAAPIAVSLHVTGVADIDVDNDTLDYGNVFVNGTYTMSVNVINAGTDLLTVSGVSIDEPAFTAPADGFALNPGETHEVIVTFAPTNAQTYNGVMTIASDDPDEATYEVVLTGVAQNPPVIGVTPTSLSADLITGETYQTTFTISNTGEADLDYAIDIEYTGAPLKARISKVHLPPSDGNFEKGTDAPSFLPAPKTMSRVSSNGTKGSTAYAANLFGDPSPIYQTFDTDDPETTTDLFAVTNLFAGALSHNEANVAYGVDYDNNHLYKLDLTTNSTEDLGTVSGYQGGDEVATGMAYYGDVCYLVTYGSASNLYTLDVETATATFIGTITDGIIISIAADDEGLYGVDLSNDVFVGIDMQTGAGTEIGSIGFDANYAQGMGFDHDSGEMYLAAYNNAKGQGELRVVDRTTGNTMFLGTLSGGAEFDMISFMGASGGAWLTLDNTEGTLPQNGSVDITVTFDANGLVGGDYTANININSNDPVNPVMTVAASMHVTGAPNLETEPRDLHFGEVFVGYPDTRSIIVSNTGTDDLTVTDVAIDNEAFTVNATLPVTITAGNSVVWDVTVNPTALGDISGTMAISSNDANDPVYNVALTATAIEPPIVEFSATEINEVLEQGSTSERTLTITNNGGSPLEFAIDVEMLKKSTKTVNIHLNESFPTANESSKRNVQAPSMIDEQDYVVNKGLEGPKSGVSVLILSPDPYGEYVSNLYDALSAFDDLEVTHYPEDAIGDLTLDDLTPYQVVIIQNDYKWSAAGGDVNVIGDLIADYIDQGGKVVANMYIYSYDEWGFGGRFITEGYGPFTGTTQDIWGEGTLGTVYEPNHPVMSGVTALNDTWGHQDPGLASNALLIADWNDGQPMIAVNDNVVGLNILPINENGIWSSDIATLLHNSIVWLGGGAWLTVDPTEGIVANGKGSMDVVLGFNAEDLDQGDYFAILHVATNDPATPNTDINVNLGVISDVGDEIQGIPTEFKLSQNYPNPFNPSTIITYAVPVDSKVTIKIFDILGREITTLVNKEVQAGTYRVQFNAHNLTSGVYFYAIRAEGANGKRFIDAKKLMLMK